MQPFDASASVSYEYTYSTQVQTIQRPYLNFPLFLKQGPHQVSYIAFDCYVCLLFIIAVRKALKCLHYRWGSETQEVEELARITWIQGRKVKMQLCISDTKRIFFPLSYILLPSSSWFPGGFSPSLWLVWSMQIMGWGHGGGVHPVTHGTRLHFQVPPATPPPLTLMGAAALRH